MPGIDFVHVRLTAAGERLAGEHTLRISGGRRTFQFKAGESLRVERSYEWKAILATRHTPAGEPLCELVPDAAPVPTLVPAASQETP